MDQSRDNPQPGESDPLRQSPSRVSLISSDKDLDFGESQQKGQETLNPSSFIRADFDFDEDEDHPEQEDLIGLVEPTGGCIGRVVGNFWRWLESEVVGQKKIIEGALKVFVLLLLLTYLGAALYMWIRSGVGFTFCRGYGLGAIVFTIATLIFLHSKISSLLQSHTRRGSVIVQNISHKVCSFTELPLGCLGVLALVSFIGYDTRDEPRRLLSFGGWLTFGLTGLLFSAHPEHIRWRTVFRGLSLQIIIGIVTVKWSFGRKIFECLGNKVKEFLDYGYTGAAFAYGDFLVHEKKIFAFQAMCVLYFMGMVMQILFYYGWLQTGCYKLGSLMQRALGTTIIESVNAVMTVFLGMNEVPFVYHTYIKYLTRSEIHAIMTACFAAVSGSMLAAYTSVGADPALIITASSMAAPAALGFAKLFYPETRKTKTSSKNIVLHKSEDNSVMDAACNGASMAIMIIQGILASLIAFISFIAFLDGVLGYLGSLVGAPQLTFEYALEIIFIPIAWLLGVQPDQCQQVAKLIGMKTTVNEFIAYKELGVMKEAGSLSPRSEAIATFALCGFANPGSVSIMLATLSGFCPEQRPNIISVALRAFIAATLTSFMSASIVGIMLPESGFSDDLGFSLNATEIKSI